MNARAQKLAENLEEPLIVTTPANIRYLTGFVSSNVSVVVEPERSGCSPISVTPGPRAPSRTSSSSRRGARRSPTWPSSCRHVRLREHQSHLPRLRDSSGDGGLELVPRIGLRRGAPRGQGRGRAGEDPPVGRRSRTRRTSGSPRSDSSAAPSVSSPGGCSSSSTSSGPRRSAFDTIVAAGAERRPAARRARGERVIEQGTTVVVDAGAVLDGYCSDCTRTFATGELPDELAARVRRLSRGAARRVSRRLAPASRQSRPTRPHASVIDGGRLRRGVRPRPRPRRRHRRARGAARGPNVAPTRSSPTTSSRSSRGSTSREPAASGSRISSSSPTVSRRCSPASRKSS